MKHYKIFFALVFVALLFTNCDPNDSSSNSQNDDTFAENFGASASRDFIGQVVDVDNVPLQNATITIGTSTVQTDVNGVFIINGAAVHERFAYITAKKTGYIDGSRAMVPTNGKNNVKIMLLPNASLETIQSGETSEVSIYSGTKVVFDGAFQDENGAAYMGAVQVAMFHLTPSDENIDKLMPGMLYAQTQTNEEAVLETYGMLNVELRGSAGQKLNIATGHTAEITIRIDDSQIANAPSTIPLWHFDEAKGYWKEDGVATKVGNKYVGEVSHFSWWNCDTFSSTVNLTVTVVNSQGSPITGIGVNLIVNETNFSSSVQTTSNTGQVSGLIPANQTLTLNIYGPCGILSTTTIGPFTTSTILPNIVIGSNAQITSTNIVGKLVKCDYSNVTNGYVLYNNSDLYPVTNGDFNIGALYCNSNANFTLKGVDFDNLQQTELIAYNYSPTATQIGILPTCNTINEFIIYTVNNNPTRYIFDGIHLQTVLGWNYGGGPGCFAVNFQVLTGDGFSVGTSSHSIGNYGGMDSYIAYLNGSGASTYSQTLHPNCFGAGNTNFLSVSINKYGAVGEYIDITFSGSTFISTTGQTINLSGIAHVIRDF